MTKFVLLIIFVLINSPSVLTVIEWAAVDAARCSVSGDGLVGGLAGNQTVLVSAVDKLGRPVTAGAAFQLRLSTLAAGFDAVHAGDGLWRLTYAAPTAGRFVLSIAVGSPPAGSFASLPGGPWTVAIEAGPVDPGSCVAEGRALSTGFVDVDNVFSLQLRDALGNPVLDAAAGSIDGYLADQPNVLLTSDYVELGRYRVAYTPRQTGATLLHVFVDGGAIAGSPFAVDIVDDQLSVPNTLVYGPGLTAATCGRPSYFFVALRDAQNNSVDAEARVRADIEQTVCADCSPVLLHKLPTLVLPIGLGVYEVAYSPVLAVRTRIAVRVNGVPLAPDHALRPTPGQADARKTNAYGNGLLYHTVDGDHNNHFFVQPRDAQSNPIRSANATAVVVRVRRGNHSLPAKTVHDPHCGCYRVRYSAAGSAPVHIDVALQELTGALAPIRGSPFRVDAQAHQWLQAFLFGSFFFFAAFVASIVALVAYPRLVHCTKK